MTRATIGLRALQTVTGAALLGAAALLVLPSHAAVVPRAPTLPPMQAQAPTPQSNTTALTDSIVNANIFSLAREAPDERTFVAAAADPLPETDAAAPFETDAASGNTVMPAPTNRVPALFGVVDGPAGRASGLCNKNTVTPDSKRWQSAIQRLKGIGRGINSCRPNSNY